MNVGIRQSENPPSASPSQNATPSDQFEEIDRADGALPHGPVTRSTTTSDIDVSWLCEFGNPVAAGLAD